MPFTLTGVRPILTPPLPWISSFHEINVRTYVHLNGRDPGVWFFSLDASSTIAVAAARAAYKLPYFRRGDRLHASAGPMPRIDFDSRRTDPRGAMPADAHMRYQPGRRSGDRPPRPERSSTFWSSATSSTPRTKSTSCTAPASTISRTRSSAPKCPLLEETLIWAAGIKRAEAPGTRHYAREVNVKVYPLERVRLRERPFSLVRSPPR